MATGLIYINCGFPLAVALGGFGNIQQHEGGYHALGWLVNPILTIYGIEITGSHAILGVTVAMIIGTALFLNSRAFSAQAVSYGTFTGIFWVSVASSTLILYSLASEFPGMEIVLAIFLMACTLTFAMALIQMPTGGQKSHL